MIEKIIWKIIKIFKLMFIYINYHNNVEIKGNIYFRYGFHILCNSKSKIVIGKDCFFNNYCSINCMDNIRIGNNCLFGENVKIYDHNHIFNKSDLISEQGFKAKKIEIGDNCWIGSNVIILKGTKIGNNCVIGAGCIVSGVIKDNSLVKSERKLFVEEIKIEGDKNEKNNKN